MELWSGLLFAAQAVTMAIFSPIWGAVADRYGRKLMVMRAMLGGAVILTLMGFVQNVQQLLILRAIQGMLTGTVTAATTLVASTAPRERSGYALGLLQMAIWGGASLGPMMGGLIADTWGYRAAFIAPGVLLFLAGLTIWLFVEEEFEPPEKTGEKGDTFLDGLKLVVRNRTILSLFATGFSVRSATRLMGPVLPLFIQSLAPGSERIASLTGLISGVRAGSGAAGAVTLGRASDKLGHRRVLLASAAVVATLYVPQFFVTEAWQLLVLQGGLGFAMTGVLASLSALLAREAPKGREGVVYGVEASVSSGANALGPMLGAAAATTLGLRAPFLIAAGTIALAWIVAWALVPGRGAAETGAGPPT